MGEAIIEHIEFLFYRFGSETLRQESVTLLEHALQCAHLAEHAGADDALVTAALLHFLERARRCLLPRRAVELPGFEPTLPVQAGHAGQAEIRPDLKSAA